MFNALSRFDDWFVNESRMAKLEEVFPGWAVASPAGDETTAGAALTELDSIVADRDVVIAELQQTVVSLIADRDAYKTVVNEIGTIAGLMADRDVYKQVVNDVLVGMGLAPDGTPMGNYAQPGVVSAGGGDANPAELGLEAGGKDPESEVVIAEEVMPVISTKDEVADVAGTPHMPASEI